MKNDIVIRLYHGRKDPKQEMDDWGDEGPIIGPLSGVICTYANELRLFADGDWKKSLKYVDDLIHCNGIYYGDWEILSLENAKGLNWPLLPFEQIKDAETTIK